MDEDVAAVGIAAVGRILDREFRAGVNGGAEDGAHSLDKVVGEAQLFLVCFGTVESSHDLVLASVAYDWRAAVGGVGRGGEARDGEGAAREGDLDAFC